MKTFWAPKIITIIKHLILAGFFALFAIFAKRIISKNVNASRSKKMLRAKKSPCMWPILTPQYATRDGQCYIRVKIGILMYFSREKNGYYAIFNLNTFFISTFEYYQIVFWNSNFVFSCSHQTLVKYLSCIESITIRNNLFNSRRRIFIMPKVFLFSTKKQ